MAHSVKFNFVLNFINTIVGLLFPLITFPYISRILDPDGVGLVAFYASIINYIVLFTALGIPLYAVREISRVRDNKLLRNQTTVEILLLHAMLSIVGYVVVLILCLTVSRIYDHIVIFLIQSASIGLSVMGVSWFYQGVEDFKYITIRSLVVRLICVISLFVFVRHKTDVLAYSIIVMLSSVGNNVLNFFRLRRYFSTTGKIRYCDLNISRHLFPALKIFVLNVIISIYVNLDSVMLGFIKNDTAVGLYSAASRITHMLLGIVTSLGGVLMPRLSNYVQKNNWTEFKRIKDKAIGFVITFSLPISVGLILIAPELIWAFAGIKYGEAVLTIRIMSPIILFIGLSGILGMQVLYSQGKENLVIISTASGAIVNFSINMLLIPSLSQDGAAIATSIAEAVVMIVMMIIGRKFINYNYFNRLVIGVVVSTVIMAISVSLYRYCVYNTINIYGLLITEILLGLFIYTVLLYIFNNEFILEVKTVIRRRLKKI